MKINILISKATLPVFLVTVALLSGCVGAGLRNIMTDDKDYQELVKEIPGIQASHGRVFFYSPKGGPSYPLNSMGDMDFFSIDNTIYRFGGTSYFYLDIKAGPHLMTTTNLVVRGFASNKKQAGENKLEINIKNNETIYLRLVNHSKSKSINDRAYDISVVDKGKAEMEMEGLSLWNNHETTMVIE